MATGTCGAHVRLHALHQFTKEIEERKRGLRDSILWERRDGFDGAHVIPSALIRESRDSTPLASGGLPFEEITSLGRCFLT